MWRHVAANALTFFVVVLFLVAGVVTWGANAWREPGPLAQAVCVEVEANETFRDLSDELAEKGAVAQPAILRIGADYAGRAQALKQGSFLVPARASMAEITDIVTGTGASTCGTEGVLLVGVARTLAEVRELDPETAEYVETASWDPLSGTPAPPSYEAAVANPDTAWSVRVIEGTTVWQVVEALNAFEVLEGDVAAGPAEGTLAPDTYAVEPGTPVASVLSQMEDAQSRILAEAWEARAPDLPVATPEEALTLASIVEKETGVPEERPLVAAVFVNRLRDGMRLQTDPAVIYGVTNGQGPLGRGLTQSELDAETPFNTYRIDGLPPTPIANPGRAAIEAALNPEATDFLYFVADGTGGHAFATNLDDHNENVARWREVEAAEAAQAEAAEGAAATP